MNRTKTVNDLFSLAKRAAALVTLNQLREGSNKAASSLDMLVKQAVGYATVNDFQRPTGPLPSDRSASGAAAWQPAPAGMVRMRNDVTGDVFYAPSVEIGRQWMGDPQSAAALGIKPGVRVDQGYQQQMDASRSRAMNGPGNKPPVLNPNDMRGSYQKMMDASKQRAMMPAAQRPATPVPPPAKPPLAPPPTLNPNNMEDSYRQMMAASRQRAMNPPPAPMAPKPQMTGGFGVAGRNH